MLAQPCFYSLALLAVFSFLHSGCVHKKGPLSPRQTTEDIAPVYPVNPQDHVEDKTKNAMEPSAFDPIILNPIAYARYAANSMDIQNAVKNTKPDEIAAKIILLGKRSLVSPSTLLEIYQAQPVAAEVELFRKETMRGGLGLQEAAPLSSLGKRIFAAKSHLATCIKRSVGSSQVSGQACCQALALPYFFLDAWDKISAGVQVKLSESVQKPNFFETFFVDFVQPLPEVKDSSQPSNQYFEHFGIKAWLAACAPIVRAAPPTIAEFKTRYGDFRADKSWTKELHPASLAKLAGRRIYRNKERSVSVAESLDDTCGVRETEAILTRGDGNLDFLAYSAQGQLVPHGFFPVKLAVDAVKYAPDACMGCHYKFDTREFSVQFPSFKALALQYRKIQNVPQWKDQSACLEEGEALILHKAEE